MLLQILRLTYLHPWRRQTACFCEIQTITSHIAIVPCIGLYCSHRIVIGLLDSVSVQKRQRSETVQGLVDGGKAILNRDDERVRAMAPLAPGEVLYFGKDADVSYRLLDLDAQLRARVAIRLPDAQIEARLSVRGAHQQANAAAAAAAGYLLEVPADKIAHALEHASAGDMRMNVQTSARGVTIIDDSYNANPTSMLAGLEALNARFHTAAYRVRRRHGRTG